MENLTDICNVSCRALFEKDKLVFSFMLCAEIMKAADIISPNEWNFFLRGAAGMDRVRIMDHVCSVVNGIQATYSDPCKLRPFHFKTLIIPLF